MSFDDRLMRSGGRSGVGDVDFIEPLAEIVHGKNSRMWVWRESSLLSAGGMPVRDPPMLLTLRPIRRPVDLIREPVVMPHP
jgi:hypothetical protein